MKFLIKIFELTDEAVVHERPQRQRQPRLHDVPMPQQQHDGAAEAVHDADETAAGAAHDVDEGERPHGTQSGGDEAAVQAAIGRRPPGGRPPPSPASC